MKFPESIKNLHSEHCEGLPNTVKGLYLLHLHFAILECRTLLHFNFVFYQCYGIYQVFDGQTDFHGYLISQSNTVAHCF